LLAWKALAAPVALKALVEIHVLLECLFAHGVVRARQAKAASQTTAAVVKAAAKADFPLLLKLFALPHLQKLCGRHISRA
jgi:hypothetical protein